MVFKVDRFRMVAVFGIALLASSFAGCATDDSPGSAASGPGIENPASAPLGSIPPAIGGAGNGGGVSGGGAGVGSAGQGAR